MGLYVSRFAYVTRGIVRVLFFTMAGVEPFAHSLYYYAMGMRTTLLEIFLKCQAVSKEQVLAATQVELIVG